MIGRTTHLKARDLTCGVAPHKVCLTLGSLCSNNITMFGPTQIASDMIMKS